MNCGACCATYRVSFYWGETALYNPGGVPEAATEKLNHHYVAMRGTNQKNPGCYALRGEINKQVSCSIYENRPTPCREFTAGEPRCYEARLKHGISKQPAPLSVQPAVNGPASMPAEKSRDRRTIKPAHA
ncbi:MAG: YkgJ family cysteine cluster protein [Gammaproteobacteria bacterium]|nr:YkgJ family cysteine cluster protein [Gammaproteobacteria bacterium]